MTDLNVILGVPAILAGFLLLWAFRGYALVVGGSGVRCLGAAIFWITFRSTGRSIWWDVFEGFGLGNTSNWAWNLIGLYASYLALKGLHLLLPPDRREEYSILTVAFYPRRLWRRVAANNEEAD